MKTRTEPQLDFAEAIRQANALKEIGKITEEQYRRTAYLFVRALRKPETLTETGAIIAREVARKIFAIFAIDRERRRLEAKFDILLAECEKERLAGQQPQESSSQPATNQKPDTPPQDPQSDPPLTDKTT